MTHEERSADRQHGHGAYWHGLHRLTHVLDGEWIPAILATLVHGPRHFTEILTSVQDSGIGQPDPRRRLHDSILGRTLRRMEDNGLITKHELATAFPKSTTYELTPWTTDLLTALVPAVHWTRSMDMVNDRPSPEPEHARTCPTRGLLRSAAKSAVLHG